MLSDELKKRLLKQTADGKPDKILFLSEENCDET